MALNDEIQSAVKSGNAILGKRESLKAVKSSSPKLIVIAENIPVSLEKEIRHSAEISGADVQVFHGSSKDLGTACGRPFPVSTLVIKV